ncbi:diiron oxygenase [Streptomyces sp. NPDC048281]|uniref:diiron oxygenase n=1 Tax=Streptomyces sp. NPDC048281 TaxID=3154715 RepID=UPI003434EA88
MLNEVPGDPSVVRVVRDHARDEGRHHRFFSALFRELWTRLSAADRIRAAHALPELIRTALTWDLASVRASLRLAGLDPDTARRVADDYCAAGPDPHRLNATVRSTLRLCAAVGVFELPRSRDPIVANDRAVRKKVGPHDFQAFHGALGSASGAQSAQFHEVEAVLAGRGRTRAMGWLTDAERARLDRRLLEPTLWDGFLAVLTGVPRAGRAAALRGRRRGRTANWRTRCSATTRGGRSGGTGTSWSWSGRSAAAGVRRAARVPPICGCAAPNGSFRRCGRLGAPCCDPLMRLL